MSFGFRKKSKAEEDIEFLERGKRIEKLESKIETREKESEQKMKLAKLKRREFETSPFGGAVFGAKKTAEDIIKVSKPLAKNIIAGFDQLFPPVAKQQKKKKQSNKFGGGF